VTGADQFRNHTDEKPDASSCFAARCGPDRLQRRKTMRQGHDLPVYLGLSMGDIFISELVTTLFWSTPGPPARSASYWATQRRTAVSTRSTDRQTSPTDKPWFRTVRPTSSLRLVSNCRCLLVIYCFSSSIQACPHIDLSEEIRPPHGVSGKLCGDCLCQPVDSLNPVCRE
jgi:hypothetical protein